MADIAAGVRLGDREGPLFLHALLNGDEAQERKRCLMLLARPGAAMLVVPMLEEYAATLSGEERGLLSAVLLFAGSYRVMMQPPLGYRPSLGWVARRRTRPGGVQGGERAWA